MIKGFDLCRDARGHCGGIGGELVEDLLLLATDLADLLAQGALSALHMKSRRLRFHKPGCLLTELSRDDYRDHGAYAEDFAAVFNLKRRWLCAKRWSAESEQVAERLDILLVGKKICLAQRRDERQTT